MLPDTTPPDREATDRNVYILGAGFSADAGAPVIHDFLDRSREIFDDPNSGLTQIERGWFQKVFEFRSKIAKAREKVVIDLDDIEQLFGMVEMSCRLRREKDSLRASTVYLIARTLALTTTERTAGPPKHGFQVDQAMLGTDVLTGFARLPGLPIAWPG